MVNVNSFLDLSIFLVFTAVICLSDGKRPDALLCADPECKGIISMAKTVLKYAAGDKDMISFLPNKDVRILGKSMDGKVLKISYQGREGFAPAQMIRESKMFVKSSALVKVEDVATETSQPVEKDAGNETELPNRTIETAPSVDDVKIDGVKPDPAIESAKFEASNEMNSKEDDDNEAEVLDEDEALELEMEGKKPVAEEPFVKKDVYKVGEGSAPVQPDLEIIGLEENVTENTISANKTDESLTEKINTSAQASAETMDTSSVNVNEEKLPKASEPEIVPTTPILTVPDTENISVENIEPSETNAANLSATQIPDALTVNLKDDFVEYDGTKIDTKLLENEIEPTVTEALFRTPILKTATVIPTPVVEQKSVPDPKETLNTVDNQTVESTLATPVDLHTESKNNDVKVPEQPKIHTTPKSTEPPPIVNTSVPSSNESAVKEKLVDVKKDDIVAPLKDTLDNMNPIADVATIEESSELPEQMVPESITSQTKIPSKDINLQEKSQEKEDLRINSDPIITQKSPTNDSADEQPETSTAISTLPQKSPEEQSQETEKAKTDSKPTTNQVSQTTDEWQKQPEIVTTNTTPVHEPLEDKPQEKGEIPIPTVAEPPVVVAEKEERKPIAHNEPNPNDIFSSNYDPGTSNIEVEKDQGNWYDGILFAFEAIFDSVQGLFSSKSSESDSSPQESESLHSEQVNGALIDEHCEKLEDGSCPKQKSIPYQCNNFECLSNLQNLNYDRYADEFLKKIVAMSDVVFLLAFTGFCVLLFTLGHCWLANDKREKEMIFKMNIVEKDLLRAQIECSTVKEKLVETHKKLTSIENESFGTDDMIRQCESEKADLREQIASLKDELETAAEAGLELNKMVSELLNNQSGSDSIISSVEELQRQLNEQEAATVYINNLLAEKSRENSELQVMLAETNQKFSTEIDDLLKSNEILKTDKKNLETELKETLYELEKEFNADLEQKSEKINQLKLKNDSLQRKYDEITSRWQISTARAEALEDSIKKIKSLNGKDIKTVIEITNANAKLLAAQTESESLREELENEIDSKRRLEGQIKLINNEITNLRAELNQNEKDKLEAQTRLDVLSSYFKEKEAQLQKELSVKEALFMKQQGESTSTVERVRSLQDEIQGLRSQNDQLRAEIEAQSAAHKAQINAAESRAHDSWLATKQAERRLDEAKIEAAVLRKRLTTLSLNAGVPENSSSTQPHSLDGMIAHDAPSPIHMESPGSPLMNLPLPPVFLPPPPLIGSNPSAFMPGPPPPLIPLPTHGEMRPAPLGRLMSPPPNNYPDDRDRYSSHRYSPDNRYGDYPRDLYETETDFSPPPSPEPYRRERNNYRDRNRDYSRSPTPPQHQQKKRASLGKGSLSSGSVEAPPHKHRGGKV